MRSLTLILTGCLCVFLYGCQSQKVDPQLAGLKEKNANLQKENDVLRVENSQLKNQVSTLTSLPKEVAGKLYNIAEVKLTNLSNLYDKNKDGTKETLIVYLKPIDQQADTVKALGTVDVELWNLDLKGDKALVGQWHVVAEELDKLWFNTLMTSNYRLTFDVSDKITGKEEQLTLRTMFTDFVSGKVFKEEKTIKP